MSYGPDVNKGQWVFTNSELKRRHDFGFTSLLPKKQLMQIKQYNHIVNQQRFPASSLEPLSSILLSSHQHPQDTHGEPWTVRVLSWMGVTQAHDLHEPHVCPSRSFEACIFIGRADSIWGVWKAGQLLYSKNCFCHVCNDSLIKYHSHQCRMWGSTGLEHLNVYNIVKKRISFLMVLLVESNLEMMKGCRTASSADLSVRGDKSSLCRALKGPCHSCGNEGDAPQSSELGLKQKGVHLAPNHHHCRGDASTIHTHNTGRRTLLAVRDHTRIWSWSDQSLWAASDGKTLFNLWTL